MGEDRQDPRLSASGLPAEEEAAVRELLESAGHRPAVPAEDLAAIKAAARAQWQEVVAVGQRRSHGLQRSVPLAFAAGLLLALAIFWWRRTAEPPPTPGPVATVQLLKGEVQVEELPDGGGGRPALAVGDALAAGTVLATSGGGSPGLVALRLAGGKSVRLDADTRVRLVASTRLELEAGAVYVDSGGPAAGSLEIGTPFGNVREVGTQFEVRLETGGDLALRVRVREGAVSLVRRGGAEPVGRGEELRLRRDGRVSRRTVELHGPAWDWVLAAAPVFEIDGSTLSEYLGWVSRETGRRLRYEDRALADLAAGIRLHGTIEGMTPDESASVVLPGSGLGYRVEAGTLVVTRR